MTEYRVTKIMVVRTLHVNGHVSSTFVSYNLLILFLHIKFILLSHTNGTYALNY